VLAEGGGVKLGAHPDWGGGSDPWLGGCFVQRIENIIKLFQILTPAAPHPPQTRDISGYNPGGRCSFEERGAEGSRTTEKQKD
jgi:hypothetical protein